MTSSVGESDVVVTREDGGESVVDVDNVEITITRTWSSRAHMSKPVKAAMVVIMKPDERLAAISTCQMQRRKQRDDRGGCEESERPNVTMIRSVLRADGISTPPMNHVYATPRWYARRLKICGPHSKSHEVKT